MLGQGMPWHIILPFFLLGIILGLSVARRDHRRNDD